MKVAPEALYPVAEADLFKSGPGARRYCRQVEQLQLQPRVARAHERQEGALPAADVEQAVVLRQVVGVEDIVRHRRQRGRHDFRVGGHPGIVDRLWPRGVGVRPVARQLRAEVGALAQQRDGVGEVVIRHLVVTDERRDPDIAHQRRPQRPQSIAAVPALDQQAQRRGRIEQPLGTRNGHLAVVGDLLDGAGTIGQVIEQVDLHAGIERLRVDEPRHQVEHLPRPVARDGGRERKARAPALELVGRNEFVPAIAHALEPRGRQRTVGCRSNRDEIGRRARAIGGRNGGRGQRLLGGIHSS